MNRPLLLAALLAAVLLPATGCLDDEASTVTAPTSASALELADKSLAALAPETSFDPAGWETNDSPPRMGSKRATFGGSFTVPMVEYFKTFAYIHPNGSSDYIRRAWDLCYEALAGPDMMTLKNVGGLATHWKIGPDKLTFWFRVNPKARFSDGRPVTALDVVETWKFMVDPANKAPFYNMFFGKFEEPVAENRQVVRFKAKAMEWRMFMSAGGFYVLPAHYLMGHHDLFLKDYNFKMVPGSGPYVLESFNTGRDATFKKRTDWWDQDNPTNQGVFNFERIKWIAISDENLTFEKFKKGELDYYYCNIAKRWAEECEFDKVQKGWIAKTRVWTEKAQGIQGFALNMRTWPFNDLKVRQAFFYLQDRQKLNDKLFFGQYTLMDSLYPHSANENPDNVKYRYDPEKAKQLLTEAGYVSRNDEGILVGKDGKPLELTLLYSDKSSERIYTPYQEDLLKAGIKLNLKLATRDVAFQMMSEHNFEITNVAWTGLEFPNPEGSLHSRYADPLNTNNVTGVKDPELDKLIEQYNVCFDAQERVRLMKEIDKLAYGHVPYILAWYCPYERLLWWDRYGMPDYAFAITGNYWDMLKYWWIDQAKVTALEAAQKADAALPRPAADIKFWEEFRATAGKNWEELKARD